MKEEGRKHQDPEPEGKIMEHTCEIGEGKRPDTLTLGILDADSFILWSHQNCYLSGCPLQRKQIAK